MLLRDDRLHEKVKQACIQRARHEFCNDSITTLYEQIYYRVLGIEAELPVVVCGE